MRGPRRSGGLCLRGLRVAGRGACGGRCRGLALLRVHPRQVRRPQVPCTTAVSPECNGGMWGGCTACPSVAPEHSLLPSAGDMSCGHFASTSASQRAAPRQAQACAVALQEAERTGKAGERRDDRLERRQCCREQLLRRRSRRQRAQRRRQRVAARVARHRRRQPLQQRRQEGGEARRGGAVAGGGAVGVAGGRSGDERGLGLCSNRFTLPKEARQRSLLLLPAQAVRHRRLHMPRRAGRDVASARSHTPRRVGAVTCLRGQSRWCPWFGSHRDLLRLPRLLQYRCCQSCCTCDRGGSAEGRAQLFQRRDLISGSSAMGRASAASTHS